MPTLNASLSGARWWILGPWRDLALFALAPVWIIPLIWGIKDRVDMGAVGAGVLALGAMGHHLPGFIRAYTDPVLFRKFRARFILAPVFFASICLYFAWRDLRGLELVLVSWGMWHGAMQVNGFMRIYDAKVGSFSPVTGWLDWAMCLAWFGWGIFHSPARMASLFVQFYGSGGGLIPPGAFHAFTRGWDLLACGITAAFLINAFVQARRGAPQNPVKFLVMASSFSFWWFAMVKVNDLLLGVILFEIFHDVQYNTLVWLYNRRRVAQNLSASLVERFLFQPNAGKIALYGALILVYGSLGIVMDYGALSVPMLAGAEAGTHFLTKLLMVSAFLHFYYDGFIWRVREDGFRRGLGISTAERAGSEGAGTSPVGPGFRAPGKVLVPAFKWALFLVPVAYLATPELRKGTAAEIDQFRNMAAHVPDSWFIQFMLANMEKGAGDKERAIAHYQRSVDLKPDLDVAHLMLGELYYLTGKPDRSIRHYRQAAALDPSDAEARHNLGMLLLSRGEIPSAIAALREAVSLEPGNPGYNYNLAVAYMTAKDAAAAIPFLKETARLDPGHKAALNHLGVALQVQGNVPEAVEFYRRALAVDARYEQARLNLAQAEKLLEIK
jgi:tetratricopeptide (TPR) repeat protein